MEEVWAGCCIAQAHEKHMLASDGTDPIKLSPWAMYYKDTQMEEV